MEQLNESLLQLITETATNMPTAVRKVLDPAHFKEKTIAG